MKIKNPERKLLIAVAIALGLAWSWIFFIDATKITSSSLVAIVTMISSFAIIIAASSAVFYLAIRYLVKSLDKQKNPSILFLIKVFIVWALAEWLVSWMLGLLWAGRNSLLDTVIPFGSFTPLLMFTPLGLLSRLVGYFGLSAFFVTICTALVLKPYRKYGLLLTAIAIIGIMSSWLAYRNPDGTTIDTLVTAERLGQPEQIYTDAELVVLPEYGLDATDTNTLNSRVISNTGVSYVVGSKQYPTDKGIQNVLIFANTQDGFVKEQPKQRLVPAGEYLPYGVEFLLRLTRQSGVLAEFEYSRAVVKGDKPVEPFYVRESIVVGAEVCSSIIATEDYRKLAQKGSTLFTNSASLEIFNGSKIFNAQHKGMAKFMAVANARPMLQASMDGPAFALDHNGAVINQLNPIGNEQAAVTTNTKKTPYTLLGEWPVVAGLMLFVFTFAKAIRKRFLR